MAKDRVIFLVVSGLIVVCGVWFYNFYSSPSETLPVDRDPDSVAASCLKCHSEMEPKEGYFVHATLESCTTCHTDHIATGEKAELTRPVQELCLMCHTDASDNMDFVHAPYDTNCLSCHDAHQSPYPGILVQEERSLCLDCHSNVENLEHTVKHEPFVESCSACHEPHASENYNLLFAETPEMCYECHSDLGKGAKAVKHNPFSDGDCMTCHEVHSSPIEKSALLVQEERSLCLECHSSDVSLGNPMEHQPFKQSCVSCHEPHEADIGNLLVDSSPDLCYSCHSSTKRELGKSNTHKPFSDGNCFTCHEVHTSPVKNSALLIKAERSMCLDCHSSEVGLGKSVEHKPFTQSCNACHESHAGDLNNLLVSNTPDLCYSCHTTTKNELNQFKKHKPFSDGNCFTCHEVHTSDIRGQALLAQSTPSLCYDCHGSTKLELNLNVKHEPFAVGDCASCHKPHAAPANKLLTNINRTALCQSCHTDTRQEFQQTSSHPVGPGNFNCSSCHTRAHAGSNENLLRATGDSLCNVCHSNTLTEFQIGKHSGISAIQNCNSCHVSHGSPSLSLLVKSEEATCTQCHDTKAGGFVESTGFTNHPIGPGTYLEQGSSYCFSCHAFHGPSYGESILKQEEVGMMCMECHTDESLKY